MGKVHGEHSLEEQGKGAGSGGQTMAARREKLRRALERLARAEEVRGAGHQERASILNEGEKAKNA